MSEQITYGQMCDVVAEDWNREQTEVTEERKLDLTGKDIWEFDLIKEFPALYLPQLYDAAKTGNLLGLLLTDNTCAGMFMRYLSKRGPQ